MQTDTKILQRKYKSAGKKKATKDRKIDDLWVFGLNSEIMKEGKKCKRLELVKKTLILSLQWLSALAFLCVLCMIYGKVHSH